MIRSKYIGLRQELNRREYRQQKETRAKDYFFRVSGRYKNAGGYRYNHNQRR